MKPGAVAAAELVVALACAFALGGAAAAQEQQPARRYDLRYEALVVPSERSARVSVRLGPGRVVRSILWRVDPKRHFDFEGSGEIRVEEDGVRWLPPENDAVFRYTFRIDQLRDEASYDARCSENWALFRGDDLVPPARVVSLRGSEARARLRLRLPAGWSAATRFESISEGVFRIDDPGRQFERPTGWIVAGKLGVLRERIAGSHVSIAGPIDQGLRRHDLLALLRWTLPSLRDAVGALPPRLLIVGADDPMWRGGLSGPASVYIHADRPLISSDATSTLLHELVHAAMRARSGPGADWITEGLAELYSLELLVRSKTISRRRYERALRRLRERGQAATTLAVANASGAVAARAVTALHALDLEIEQATDGKAGLDEVLARLAARDEAITLQSFKTTVAEVGGSEFGAFFGSLPLRSAR